MCDYRQGSSRLEKEQMKFIFSRQTQILLYINVCVCMLCAKIHNEFSYTDSIAKAIMYLRVMNNVQ